MFDNEGKLFSPIFQAAGIVTVPELPSALPPLVSSWPSFKKCIRKVWCTLRLARTAQREAMRLEQIQTCVEHRCDLMRSDQSRMIRNLLGRQCSAIRLDKVVTVTPGGGVQVIDEPATVVQEVCSHFQKWTSKWNVQPLVG